MKKEELQKRATKIAVDRGWPERRDAIIALFEEIEATKHPKFIELTNQEKKWIKLFKGHYRELPQYKNTNGDILEILKVFYKQDYAIDPAQHYNTFLDAVFYILWDIYCKIADTNTQGHNNRVYEMFQVIFNKQFIYNNELPIERGICKLWGMISNVRFLDENKEPRFNLDLEEETQQLSKL